jgi:hypothetical protein
MLCTTTQEVFPSISYHSRRNKPHQCGCELNGVICERNTLVNLMHRYPYLDKNRKGSQKSWVFEMSLSHYIDEQIQPSQSQLDPATITDSTVTINPTLLSNLGLKTALERFTEAKTHRAIAQLFLDQNQTNTFGVFKLNLYTYLTAVIPTVSRIDEFKLQLWNRIENLMPDHNDQSLTPFLLQVTCRNLFQFLTVENARNLNHKILVDLVNNLNPLLVSELMLRILLLCPPRRVHLDKRMRLLFHHYAHHNQTEVSWLIQLLEYLNLAYCTNLSTTHPKGCSRKVDKFID